ncbi:C4-dicarboxylate transporter [Cryobacterium fucosi]|uniref:SLAC1 family transporter n=1 Tax=Cryobacterium fucosi TaxID=1259157 RepID=UPI00141A7930|nr:C4-dicarboxylate transporter [Cryobacterium fucosi]
MTARSWSFRRVSTTGRAPLASLGIPFGLAGLAGTWTMAGATLGTPAGIGDALWLLATVVWIAAIGNYLVRSRNHGGRVLRDVDDPVQGPFASLAPTTGMLIGSHLAVSLPLVGRSLSVACIGLALVLGARFVAQLAVRENSVDLVHAGYLLPTVAAFLIAGQSAGGLGWPVAAIAGIGVGLLFWLLLGTIVLARMAFRPPLPAVLLPTFAIFSAPPAVAGNAWFAVNGGGLDTAQHLLLGTFVLLIGVQLAMVVTYWRLSFTLGFWAFTFTAASSGTYALHWLDLAGAPGRQVWGYLVLAVVTALIGSIAVRSVLFLVRAHATSLRSGVALPANRTGRSPARASRLPRAGFSLKGKANAPMTG